MNYFTEKETEILTNLLKTNFKDKRDTFYIYKKIKKMVSTLVSIYYKRYFIGQEIKPIVDDLTSDIFRKLITSKDKILEKKYKNLFHYINRMITNEILQQNWIKKKSIKPRINFDIWRRSELISHYENPDILPSPEEEQEAPPIEQTKQIILTHLKYTFMYKQYIYNKNTIKVLETIYYEALNNDIYDREQYIIICAEKLNISKHRVSKILHYIFSPKPYIKTKPLLYNGLKEKKENLYNGYI